MEKLFNGFFKKVIHKNSRFNRHIALTTAGNLMVKDFLSLDKTSAVLLRKHINQVLFGFGFKPEYVMEMYHSSKVLPPYSEPDAKTLH
jgi:hypothetical protein